MTSSAFTFSAMARASSAMTQQPVFWQVRQPVQKAMRLPFREISSTVWPASRAPAAKAAARRSELLRWRRSEGEECEAF